MTQKCLQLSSKIKLVVMAILCAVLCMSLLAGCSSEVKEEKSDVEMMTEATANMETDPFYVLIVGNDSRVGTVNITNPNYSDGTGRSDTMMLCRINPKTYQIALVTVPRDTAVTLPDGTVTKINEVYRTDGIEGLRSAVEELTGVDIKYYLDMGFVDFENFIDGIGGVTANVPIDMELYDVVSGDKVVLSQGDQELDGKEALVLARVRKLYAEDIESCRQIQDRQIVQKGITQVASSSDTASAMVDILRTYADTDWEEQSMKNTVQSFADNASKISFLSGTGPYKGDFMEEYNGLWLTVRDTETWAKVIDAVEAGKDPTSVVSLPTVRAKESE
ncbi:MAG: LCP family protein [Anaerotardibacter sp.]